MKYLDCNYGCGTPHTLLFHYKIEHKDKGSKCASGNQTITGNCVEEIPANLRDTASKCSSSSSSSSSSSIFRSSSNSNLNSDSNLRSSWGIKGEALFTDSNPVSNCNSNSNSNFDSNSNSNLQSSWDTKGEATLPCHGRRPFTNSHIETKNDITNKICNRCRVIKQITCFDIKKAICKECISTKVKCEYCPSIINLSGLKSHIQNSHKDIDLAGGINQRRGSTVGSPSRFTDKEIKEE